MMGVDDVGTGQRQWQNRCKRVGRMSGDSNDRPQDADVQPSSLPNLGRLGTECQELTIDLGC